MAPACTSAGTRYLVSTMPHRLVQTMTRTVLKNEQIPNSERTSAHILCCGQHGRHGGSFRNRSVLTDVRNASIVSDQKRRLMQSWCWPRRAHLQGHGIWCQLCRIGSCRQRLARCSKANRYLIPSERQRTSCVVASTGGTEGASETEAF